MGGKKYMETFTEEGGGKTGKFVSLPIAIAGAFAAAAVAALVVGLAVGLTKKSDNSSSMTTTATTPGPEVTQTTAPLIFSWDEIRVPTHLSTSHYDLRIRPDIYDTSPANFKFNGSVVMHLEVTNVTNMVVFNLNLLTLNTESITVTENNQPINIINKEHNEKRQYYILTLERNLALGALVKVMVEFEGPIKDDLIGIYYSFYSDDNGNRRYLLGSQMQPTDARKVFPCLDEPNHKATFSIIIERKAGMSSMSNGDVDETYDLPNDWYADHFTTTVKMSTYLLAFVVSDFKCLNSTTSKSGTRVYVCARPNAIDQAQYAHEVAAPIQQYLEDFYGIPYPLNKTIHLALPDFAAGAMENWGCILYRETALLYDNTSSTAVNQQRVAVVIAHELAHMWFGNLVTPSWWDDLWLNEGFASYMEYWGVNSVQSEWKMHDQFLSEDLHSVMQTDALMTSHPIYQTVNNPDQINELFDSISYSKGASVIRMMYNFLGENAFKLGITNYLRDNSYDVAFHTELFESLKEAYEFLNSPNKLDVTGVMLTWIKQMGYPVVNMTYDSTAGTIQLTQQYFRTFVDPNANLTPSEYNYIWKVPLSVAHNDGTNFTTIINGEWLDTETGQINNSRLIGLPWIVGNPNELYYYRVNYDEENWKALIDQLSLNHTDISDASRAQLIDDSFSLGRAGVVDQLVGLRLSGYLHQELDYVPWTAASRSFGYIRRMLAETAYLNDLRSYMQLKFQTVYNSVGWSWSGTPGEETHLNRLLRGQILSLACTYGYKDCTDKAWTNFNLLLDNTTKSQVDLHARSVAYCYGVAAGDVSEWETVLRMYNTSNLATDRAMYLSAMSCADKAHILARYLDLALEEKTIRRQDVATVIVGVSRNRHGQQLAWDFVRYNWNTLFSRFSLFSLSNIVTGVTESFSTERRHAELTAFIKENEGRLGSGERAFIQAAEATRANIEWRNKNEANIANWLKQQLPPSP